MLQALLELARYVLPDQFYLLYRELMKDNCLFCKILEKKIPAEIVFENDDCLGFKDIHPAAPKHILFIPKKHIESMDKAEQEDAAMLGRVLVYASEYARKNGFQESGYRLVNNMGKDAGQTVFHIHFHLLAGRSFAWPPG